MPEQEHAGLEDQLQSVSSPPKDIPTIDLHKTKLLSSNMGRLYLWCSVLVLLDAPNKTGFVLNFGVLCFGVFLHAAMAEVEA